MCFINKTFIELLYLVAQHAHVHSPTYLFDLIKYRFDHVVYFSVSWMFNIGTAYVCRSQDSIVNIVTGYGLDDQGVGVWVLVGSRIFSSPCRPDQLSRKCGSLDVSEPYGPPQSITGIALPLPYLLWIQGHYATSRKVTASSPTEVDFFNLPNPFNHTMALGPTQPLKEMSTMNFPGGVKGGWGW
jgi:hypothetical protein